MPDGHILTDNQRTIFIIHMEHRKVLNIRAAADSDIIHITTDDGIIPHRAVLADLHITKNAHAPVINTEG